MAREHAQIKLAIWADDDFRDLTRDEQHLYFALVTHPSLSYAGVVDWRPARIAALAADWTREDVETTAKGLIAKRYIVVDEETEEALVRSFIRNDEILKQPKVALAMLTAWAGVASKLLRGVIVHEIKRLHAETPTLPAFTSTATASGERLRELLTKPGVDPSASPTPNPSGKGSGNPSATPNPKGPGNPSGSPDPDPSPVPGSKNLSSSPTADAVDDKQPKRTPRPDKNDRDDVRALCNLMVELVVANGSKRPTITKAWQDDARLLIDKDGRDLRKALELMRWAAKDTFWRSNVQCIPTFREKYDQLRLKALAEWEREREQADQPPVQHSSGWRFMHETAPTKDVA
jgi:hypothetical protein